MTPERKKEYKESIDNALVLLTDFRAALDNPVIVTSRCAYCDETFAEVESGECPPNLLEHAKTCPKSPSANEIERLQKLVKRAYREGGELAFKDRMFDEDNYCWDHSEAREALEIKP